MAAAAVVVVDVAWFPVPVPVPDAAVRCRRVLCEYDFNIVLKKNPPIVHTFMKTSVL